MCETRPPRKSKSWEEQGMGLPAYPAQSPLPLGKITRCLPPNQPTAGGKRVINPPTLETLTGRSGKPGHDRRSSQPRIHPQRNPVQSNPIQSNPQKLWNKPRIWNPESGIQNLKSKSWCPNRGERGPKMYLFFEGITLVQLETGREDLQCSPE